MIDNFMKQRLESIKSVAVVAETSSGSKKSTKLMDGGDSFNIDNRNSKSTLEGSMTGSEVYLDETSDETGDETRGSMKMETKRCGTAITESALGELDDSHTGGNDDKSSVHSVKNDSSFHQQETTIENGSLENKKKSSERKAMYLMSFLLEGGKQVIGSEQQYKRVSKRRTMSGGSSRSGQSSSGSKSAKFPRKLWDIINSCESGAISWSTDGESILVNYKQFQEEYLSANTFKTDNIASFIRQLNLYGFRKVASSKASTTSISSSLISSVFPQVRSKTQESDENSNSRNNTSSSPSSRFSNDDEVHEFKNKFFIRGEEDKLVNIIRTVNSTKIMKPKAEVSPKIEEASHGLTKKGKPRMKPVRKSQAPNALSRTIRNSTTEELQLAVQLINQMLHNQDEDSIVHGLSQKMLDGNYNYEDGNYSHEDGNYSHEDGDVIIENDLLWDASPMEESTVIESKDPGPRVIATFNTDFGCSATISANEEKLAKVFNGLS